MVPRGAGVKVNVGIGVKADAVKVAEAEAVTGCVPVGGVSIDISIGLQADSNTTDEMNTVLIFMARIYPPHSSNIESKKYQAQIHGFAPDTVV